MQIQGIQIAVATAAANQFAGFGFGEVAANAHRNTRRRYVATMRSEVGGSVQKSPPKSGSKWDRWPCYGSNSYSVNATALPAPTAPAAALPAAAWASLVLSRALCG